MRKPKILFYDIETSHINTLVFSLWPTSIPPASILADWHIICAAWKWQGKAKIHTAAVTDKNNDKLVTEKLSQAIHEADVIVAHNGDKFDIRKLRARMIYHDMKPISTPVSIDTLKSARKEFAFTSNRLDYIGQFLGVGKKIPTNHELWVQARVGNKKAIKAMLKYNKQDVTLLEAVYDKLRPYMQNHPNMNLFMGTAQNCTNCGSSSLIKHGTRRTRVGLYQRYLCKDCGASCSSGKNLVTTKASEILR